MKSLLNISMQIVSRNLDLLSAAANLPLTMREWLLEFLSSHDQLLTPQALRLLADPAFVSGLTKLSFYLSDQLNDDHLRVLAQNAGSLTEISVVHCPAVTDEGVVAITSGQLKLRRLELRSLRGLSSHALSELESTHLRWLDLSGCGDMDGDDILTAIRRCGSNVEQLYLNNCSGVEDLSIVGMAACLGEKLRILELDFLGTLQEPAAVINFVSAHCPNLRQLSLCRYFNPDDVDFLNLDCHIRSKSLRELDLYGNFFSVLPRLPRTITSLRLSVTGMEDVESLMSHLSNLRDLRKVRLLLSASDEGDEAVQSANSFLRKFLAQFGEKVTEVHIQAHHVWDSTMSVMTKHCTRLSSLTLDVAHLNPSGLHALFMADDTQRALNLRSLKLTRIHLPHKVLFSLGRYARNLEEVELSQMRCVDDRFLGILASNAPKLRCLNLNGCPRVTDRGLGLLARHCPLKEVRVRATGVSDAAIYILAQFCSQLEWVSHADFSGRPKFSDVALQALRDSCVNRVIC